MLQGFYVSQYRGRAQIAMEIFNSLAAIMEHKMNTQKVQATWPCGYVEIKKVNNKYHSLKLVTNIKIR